MAKTLCEHSTWTAYLWNLVQTYMDCIGAMYAFNRDCAGV